MKGIAFEEFKRLRKAEKAEKERKAAKRRQDALNRARKAWGRGEVKPYVSVISLAERAVLPGERTRKGFVFEGR